MVPYYTLLKVTTSAVTLVAEGNSHHSTVLDDHENRLKKIEKSA